MDAEAQRRQAAINAGLRLLAAERAAAQDRASRAADTARRERLAAEQSTARQSSIQSTVDMTLRESASTTTEVTVATLGQYQELGGNEGEWRKHVSDEADRLRGKGYNVSVTETPRTVYGPTSHGLSGSSFTSSREVTDVTLIVSSEAD